MRETSVWSIGDEGSCGLVLIRWSVELKMRLGDWIWSIWSS